MREELAKRVGKRGEFRATFARNGISKSRFGTKVTALFVDVRDEMHTLVTDHLWFIRGKQMDALKLQQGDRVRFMATVATYSKRAPRDAADPGDWEESPRWAREQDYKLIFPTNMFVVNRQGKKYSLPLFDQEDGNGATKV